MLTVSLCTEHGRAAPHSVWARQSHGAVERFQKPASLLKPQTQPREDRKRIRCRAFAPATKPLPYRVGHGWDLHRLEDGKRLVIGGIEVPHSKGTIAHSDGDVVLHTITDAILGALCQPDIGQLFPDKDPKWKGAASDVFLLEAVKLMEERGYLLGNIDITIIAERPKISPHKQNILDNLYRLLKTPAETINLKAKTSEGVDALGENRAIACEAVVMLVRNEILS